MNSVSKSESSQVLVSIITVVYNGASTLEQTIQSVLNQTYQNIEYIIIDGGSTDGTLEIIKKYENKIALWVSEPDNGLYDAMNKGIHKATGKLIGMINSDDWYESNAVTLAVEAYRNNPQKKIFHGDRFDVDKKEKKKIYKFNNSKLKLFYSAMTYNHPSMFVHQDIYKKFKYNTSLKAYSDYEFVLSNYLLNKNNFQYIPEPYVNYRTDGLSYKISLFTNISEGSTARLNAGLNYQHVLVFACVKIFQATLINIFGNQTLRNLGLIQ